jgi:hypothetical protein
MRDELNKNRESTDDECLVLNLDHSNNDGTHWTCLFIKNEEMYYFDSYGYPPPLEVEDYYNDKERYYSSFKIQDYGEVICGHYCIYVLYNLSKGYTFKEILDELYKYKDLK